jgi:hypothetical protein
MSNFKDTGTSSGFATLLPVARTIWREEREIRFLNGLKKKKPFDLEWRRNGTERSRLVNVNVPSGDYCNWKSSPSHLPPPTSIFIALLSAAFGRIWN